MELFKQRMVNIKITISGEEKNSRNNEMSINVDILSESALKIIYDEFYSSVYRLNETRQSEDVEDLKMCIRCQQPVPLSNNEGYNFCSECMTVEDIPF